MQNELQNTKIFFFSCFWFLMPSNSQKLTALCSVVVKFAFAAPKLWNQLPLSVHSSSSLAAFKKQLKTFFCSQTFHDFLLVNYIYIVMSLRLISSLYLSCFLWYLFFLLSYSKRCDHLKWRYINAYCMYV